MNDIRCNKQKLWRPVERAHKDIYCGAECLSTGRQCKNKGVHFVPGAFLVMEVKSCCYFCGIHRNTARNLLRGFIGEVNKFGIDKALKVGSPDRGFYEACVMSDKGENVCKQQWGPYMKMALSNFKAIPVVKRLKESLK